jgi:hypothetical protein
MSLRILINAILAAFLTLIAIFAFGELLAVLGVWWLFLILFIFFLILMCNSPHFR